MDLAELPEIFDRYRYAPFEWGTLDCCLFAANVVRDLTGVDYAADFRDMYDTETGALKIIAAHGSMEEFLHNMLGDSQAPLTARRGDFVLGQPENPALGICDGSGAVFKAPDGLTRLPLADCIRAWSCRP